MASTLRSEVCLVVLCGLPAAGKSSLARELREASSGLGWTVAALCYDELIPEEAFLTRREGDDTGQMHTEWKQRRQAVLKCLEHVLQSPNSDRSDLPDVCDIINKASWEKCIQDLLKASSKPTPVIVLLDDNFYYPSMRYEVYQLARKYSLGFCQLFLDCDLETCVRRNRSRPRPVPVEVMEEMERRLEPPHPQRNTWEKNSVRVNTTDGLSTEHIREVVDLISLALKNPLSPIEDTSEQRETARVQCAHNVVHQADQACRRLISETMKSARDNGTSLSSLKSLASELNQLKSKFLLDLKTRLLQDSSFTEFESMAVEQVAVEQVVAKAVEVFNRQKTDILLRTVEKTC